MIAAQRRLIAMAVALAAIPLAAVALGSGIHEVIQADRRFQESEITIAHGDTIRFTNEDPFVHQIYINARDLDFESRMQPPNEVIDVRFPSPGVYRVMCHIHPTMHLTVTVE